MVVFSSIWLCLEPVDRRIEHKALTHVQYTSWVCLLQVEQGEKHARARARHIIHTLPWHGEGVSHVYVYVYVYIYTYTYMTYMHEYNVYHPNLS